MRVLILGGTEFISLHLVRALLLAAGLAQTFEWFLREGLDRRDVDFSAEDALLARLG